MTAPERGLPPGPFRFAHESMATTFELIAAGHEEAYCRQAAQAVFQEIDRIERLLTRFDAGSEIGRINQLSPGDSLQVGMEAFECLAIAGEVFDLTEGAFDINVKAAVKRNARPSRKEAAGRQKGLGRFPLKLTRLSHGFAVEIEEMPLTRDYPGVDLDLGGMGKGYALDKCREVLSDWGISSALLHSGTSTVLALGNPPDRPDGNEGWRLGVGGPWECPQAPRSLLLKERALSGSGTEVKGSHILDPRSGGPAGGHAAAWVSHPSAAYADALSTAFMVMDTEEVAGCCRRIPGIWALVIVDEKKCEIFHNRSDKS